MSDRVAAPLVSVVIPTYKRPRELQRAVETALGQTMRDLEVVVVIEPDDDLAVSALVGIDDPRLRWVRSASWSGAGRARNNGAAASRGIWVALLDDDDEWLPEKLEKQLAQGPDPANTISMTLSFVVGDQGTVVLPTRPYDGVEPFDMWLFDRKRWLGARASMIQPSSLMVPRDLFERLRFQTGQHEEWEFMIRATKELGYRLLTVAEPLVVFYVGRVYGWEKSLAWGERVRSLLDKRAYSGFVLTVVTQGLPSPGRNAAFVALLRAAFRSGRPTARQLFAFALIWALPHSLRQRVRASLQHVSRPEVRKAGGSALR